MLTPSSITVAEVGLQTPESVLHDPVADVYIVSNINGSPTDKDNNGFLSRITPDGEVAELKWVEGGRDGVTLHAPKGSAIKGDTLFVADIDTVRMFHRETGAMLGARGVPNATFLNDMTVGPDGTVYVTDMGVRAGAQGFEPSGTAAVYRFGPDGQGYSTWATGLRNCSGMATQPANDALWCVVNERDGMGDDVPPDYATRVLPESFYGWPWFYIGGNEDPRLAGRRPDLRDDVTMPDVLLQAHSAPLGIAFYNGNAFPADEVIISTHPPERSKWLERGVVERAREEVPLPITHVVVDLETESQQATGAAGAVV